MPRAKQRTPELAEHVLEAAFALLGTEGLEGLTARRLAAAAGTSPAALYELFGDKAGVLRALFFAGFERLAEHLGETPTDSEPLEDLRLLAGRYRAFILAHPAWSALMFSRPFAHFDPAPEEQSAGAAVRERILASVRAAVDGGQLSGDALDIAHAYVALIQGLAAAESSHRLGRSRAAVQRRWEAAIAAMLDGFAGAPGLHGAARNR